MRWRPSTTSAGWRAWGGRPGRRRRRWPGRTAARRCGGGAPRACGGPRCPSCRSPAGRSARSAPRARPPPAAWRASITSWASSISAFTSAASSAARAPVPSRRPGMARSASRPHARSARRWRAAGRGRGRRPPRPLRSPPRSGSTPSATSRSIHGGERDGPKSMRTDREAIVTSSGGTSSARITKKVDAGGSSTYFSRIAPNVGR